MKWTRGLKVSAEMLWAYKLRTILSLLGIVVGIATVTVMAAVGKGSEQQVVESIRRMGTNLISVTAGKVVVMAGRERQAGVVTTLVPADAGASEDPQPATGQRRDVRRAGRPRLAACRRHRPDSCARALRRPGSHRPAPSGGQSAV